MAAPPDAVVFVAAFRCAVEPLIHAPENVDAAGVGRIGVVNDTVLDHKGAHARALAHICGGVGSGHVGKGDDALRFLWIPDFFALVIVFGAAFALLVVG